ncbi:MAG: hypothetical protein A3H64_03315 [Candidatus Ryanbacteria bacterium RIFCSPLOWO2_02_FULL_45_11c]|uniref:CYTH domain-containing protein n=1 Tax=Candidatus Ryanbacteria bacterium RIFCSPLOWO2_02_FULL_45_11c TaxID=1802128 RepID=A0A1G2GU89_9BACT|nr:MAG: hypothetical protein A3H64_03315 [Candidatus Ryanbacteria bacterium RIFCSPLOWO2_02_FULL_45_11c]
MKVEYEATFPNIDKDAIRRKLEQAGARLVRAEFLQKRVTFHLPEGHEISGGWARVRDEAGKITLSLKVIDGTNIENQKEILLEVNNFEDARTLLATLGCREKAYQENKRELWVLDAVEITIDEWPFLEPFVEIEGVSEEAVRSVSEKLSFNYKDALFCAVTTLYSQKYALDENIINNQTHKIVFDMENPFIKR